MKSHKKGTILIFFLVLIVHFTHAQTTEVGLDSLVANLKNYNSKRLLEKAYLQFDKPYYAAGDTIYFKAYLTMGERHIPSQISGVLHIDLINTKGNIDQSIKLQVINGISWGDFALPDNLPPGNYRVRAWTQWMRNNPGNFFEKTVSIGSLYYKAYENNIEPPLADKPDVQFFPEGGTLVTGIKSRIAFKAIGPNGLGVNVKGIVINNENKEVASFASLHLGMGSFELVPEPEKVYRAKLTFDNGATHVINLPKIETKGISLSVDNDSIPIAKVAINANSIYFNENKGKKYRLLIYSGGVATTVNFMLDSTIITLDILKRKLFTGTAVITLFSLKNEPLCERLIFVQNHDQLSLKVITEKNQYKPRQKVTVKLNSRTRADSAAKGHFSVSVTDESKVADDENTETTILTNLLLTSTLKGYIEQPNYYFNHINDTTSRYLDLIMLIHGYREFDWKQVLYETKSSAFFKPENGISINGFIKTLTGKSVKYGNVTLIMPNGGPILNQTTDQQGNFTFSNLFVLDTAKFILQAVTNNNKSTLLTYNNQSEEPHVEQQVYLTKVDDSIINIYLQNNQQQKDEYAKFGGPKGKTLKEVKIKGIKPTDNYRSSSLLGPGHANQVVHREEFEKIGGSLSTKLAGKFHGEYGYAITSTGKFGGLVIIDGVEVGTGFDLDGINGNDVETVELFWGANASIYGSEAGGGVLVITTRQGAGLQAKDVASTGVLPITVVGFYKAREFYVPKYEKPNNDFSRKDLRSTIYWKPDLITDKTGNASFDFYNADGSGTYRVVVEGIDEKGNLGRLVYKYKVEY